MRAWPCWERCSTCYQAGDAPLCGGGPVLAGFAIGHPARTTTHRLRAGALSPGGGFGLRRWRMVASVVGAGVEPAYAPGASRPSLLVRPRGRPGGGGVTLRRLVRFGAATACGLLFTEGRLQGGQGVCVRPALVL